jgi:transcription elongation factor GreA
VLTADGLARLQAEHDELTRVKRPAVVLRIRTAKEHGDLKENAEYHSAREEQSFLEGRVLAIEAILRNHVVIEAPAAGHTTIHLGSRATIEDSFGQVTYEITGSTDANPTEGRISASSPVGAALIGKKVGDDVVVRTPRGEARYRVVSIE